MPLSIGIVGLPNVGKSTTFNALTKAQNAQAANYPFCTIEPNKANVPVPDAEGTYFYASPHRPSRMAMVRILVGGDPGMVYRARNDLITIGREGNDVNFPEDPFISGRHAQSLALPDGTFQLTDLGSKNGTFVRVQAMTQLHHGDYVFLGQQLLRVEIT